ncbi:MAG: DUF2079 domain-containing protein [Sandaracinaceae bacterium]|nr:DUF2079 domain-containing protein [Sandaracinaceae bacterium]
MLALGVAQGLLFATLGLARYATFHNETFDLAFYARIAWGLTHADFWEPLVDAHVYGLRLSPILVPLGALGALFGTAPVLVVAQAAALAGASFPLARIGARHLGPAGAVLGALVWLFHPNLGHVAGYEVHAGSLAALPLAWLAWALDRGSARALMASALGVLACREDLALVVALAALVFTARHRASWRAGAAVAACATGYLLFFLLYLHPSYAPARGSLELHFGRFGGSPAEVLTYLATHPGELAAHLGAPARLLYLPKVLATFALLPLLSPRWLLPAAPVLAINLVSEWPTTTDLGVHYLTPALPFLATGALEGAGRVARHAPRLAVLAPSVVLLAAHAAAGGTPLSADFDARAHRPDARTRAARAIVDLIPPRRACRRPTRSSRTSPSARCSSARPRRRRTPTTSSSTSRTGAASRPARISCAPSRSRSRAPGSRATTTASSSRAAISSSSSAEAARARAPAPRPSRAAPIRGRPAHRYLPRRARRLDRGRPPRARARRARAVPERPRRPHRHGRAAAPRGPPSSAAS